MNYLSEILAFNDLFMTNEFSTGQIALWYALMYINNKSGWAEWFTVTNRTLEQRTGLSRNGILKARNTLAQKGLISFKTNRTNATMYKMLTIANSVQDSVQVSVQDSVQDSVLLNKQNKTKINNINNNIRAYEVYENNIGIVSPIVFDAITDYINSGIEDEMICAAIEEAVKHNKLSWAYIDAVLRDKVKRGITTYEAFNNSMQKHSEDKASENSPREPYFRPLADIISARCGGERCGE